MTFVKIGSDWYERKPSGAIKQYKNYNYNGGYTYENTEPTECIEASDWHDLYLKTGYCPLKTDKYNRDVWIDTEGNYYEGNAHGYQATRLCELLYAHDFDIGEAEDFLIEHGWIKATTSVMSEFYEKDGMYNNLYGQQKEAYLQWLQIHRK